MALSPHVFFRFLLAISYFTVEGKVQTGKIDVRKGGKSPLYQFVGKFTYGLGTGKYVWTMNVQDKKETDSMRNMLFHLYLDEAWEKVDQSASCEDKIKLATRSEVMDFPQATIQRVFSGSLTQKVRPHIWYFVVSDCSGTTTEQNRQIDYELRMTQSDESEFSMEVYQTMVWSWLTLFVFMVFLVRYLILCRRFISSQGTMHSVIKALSLAIAFQFAGQVLHIWYLRGYGVDGKGTAFLDICSEVFFMLSQVVQTTLLVAIAMGYTLLSRKSARVDIVKQIALLALIFHAVLVCCGKLQDESASKYHENEGAIGWILLTARLLLFAWFLFAIRSTGQQGGLRLAGFLQSFGFAGAIYFLAYPVLFVIVQVFAPYLRHLVLQIGLHLMQTASDVWLAELFLTRGTYFKVSALSSSFLPSGRKVSQDDFDKKD